MPSPVADPVEADQSAALMRLAFRRYASGVMLLTYQDDDGETYGMTATSVCSVSVDPPSVLACVNRRARTHDAVIRGKRFAISLLAEQHRRISEYCAMPGSVKTLPARWIVERPQGVAVIRDALGSMQCRLSKTYAAGTHSIFIGAFNDVELGVDGNPLLYFEGADRSMREVEEELSCSEAAGIIW